MRIFNWFWTMFARMENLNVHQITVLVLVIVGIGFFCMRGFGSRSNY